MAFSPDSSEITDHESVTAAFSFHLDCCNVRDDLESHMTPILWFCDDVHKVTRIDNSSGLLLAQVLRSLAEGRRFVGAVLRSFSNQVNSRNGCVMMTEP